VLGLDDLVIFVVCSNLVSVCGEVGDVVGVLVGFEELLVDWLCVLGLDYLDILII